MVTACRLRAATNATRVGYHAIGTSSIRRVALMDVTAVSQVGLTRSGVHVVVVGWMFGGVGCHATSKGAQLSCELHYAISLWSWILSWK